MIKLCSNGRHGSSADWVDAQGNIEMSVKVNGKLLVDSISRFTEDEIGLELRKPKPGMAGEPIIIKEKDFLSAIMPVR